MNNNVGLVINNAARTEEPKVIGEKETITQKRRNTITQGRSHVQVRNVKTSDTNRQGPRRRSPNMRRKGL